MLISPKKSKFIDKEGVYNDKKCALQIYRLQNYANMFKSMCIAFLRVKCIFESAENKKRHFSRIKILGMVQKKLF